MFCFLHEFGLVVCLCVRFLGCLRFDLVCCGFGGLLMRLLGLGLVVLFGLC